MFMIDNMKFYGFMHKQILILLILFVGTGPGYVYIGWLYSSFQIELLWYIALLCISAWGYTLHREYLRKKMTLAEKDKWFSRLKVFLYISFSMWSVMFVIYTSKDTLALHYIAIATQLGSSVVAATVLASQRRLAILTVVSLILPLTLYFLIVNEYYSYLLAFFTVVLAWVLLHSSNNTFNYLLKSRYQSYHDYLTKLGNRRYLIEALDDAIALQRRSQKYHFLLLVDLDHFKIINDTLGHDIGDKLLCEVANRMKNLTELKNGAKISRLGGDEFCLLSPEYDSIQECLEYGNSFAQELLEAIKQSYIIAEHHLYISASIGISILDKPSMQANRFIKEADIAMYEAKNQGRDGLIIFNDKVAQHIQRKLEIERLLHFAIESKEIYLHYQPQLNAKEQIIGCEVLARWESLSLGNVRPDHFIAIAEQTGIIIDLGHYILEESFKTLKEWDQKGVMLEHFSINISMRQMFHSSFVKDVIELSQRYLDQRLVSKLVFEITESSVAEDIHILIKNMNTLKEHGIRFSMDDFGTGYSSLSYLRQLPISELKIDKSFVAKIASSKQDRTMIKTIINIAQNLELRIVAEGVEERVEIDYLKEQECDIFQGYFYYKPMSKESFELVMLGSA
jgi:diguanylate cyclase